MKSLSNTPPTVLPGVFAQPAGARLRGAPNDEALVKVWDELGECLGYPKPDGWRIQIHKIGKLVKLFSRSGKDWAWAFPSIVKMILNQVEEDQVILDTELVGFDHNGKHLIPSRLRYAHQYRCYLLDALYLRGESLTSFPTSKRVRLMRDYLRDTFQGSFTLAEYTSIESEEDLIKFYQQCLTRKAEGFDGAIIKKLDTPYFTDVFKIKPEETVDAVVVGAERRPQGAIKALLLAVPCLERNSWVPIAKVARASTDWKAVWPACKLHILDKRPDNLENPSVMPDIWIAPKIVVTVKVTELKAGKNYQVFGDGARNCVLREDKGPREATSFEQVLQLAGQCEIPEPQQLSLFG